MGSYSVSLFKVKHHTDHIETLQWKNFKKIFKGRSEWVFLGKLGARYFELNLKTKLKQNINSGHMWNIILFSKVFYIEFS